MTGTTEGILQEYGASAAHWVEDEASGLKAVIVLHRLRDGLAAGGVRTRRYPDEESGLRDACGLARTMTWKCALSDLPVGGAKAVVFDHPALDRKRGFAALGRAIEALDGAFRTAGDVGTTVQDLRVMAEQSQYVHVDEGDLSTAVATGLRAAMEAALRFRGEAQTFDGLRVAVQGCGAIGSAVARELRARGAKLWVCDIDAVRAQRVAEECGGLVVSPQAYLGMDVDVLAPCAVGGQVDAQNVGSVRAKVLCGGANNILHTPGISTRLMAQGVTHVPDMIASAGAVVAGIARTVLHEEDPSPRLEALGETVEWVLRTSLRRGDSPHETAMRLAQARLAESPTQVPKT